MRVDPSRSHAKVKAGVRSALTTHPPSQGWASDNATASPPREGEKSSPHPTQPQVCFGEHHHPKTRDAGVIPDTERWQVVSAPDLCRNRFYSGKRGAGLFSSNIC